MPTFDRRQFLRLGAASLGGAMLPASIQRALAIDAATETGSLMDVQHVVILMQENRSFDHYFGTHPGVRGFGDRLTIPTADAGSVWMQKDVHGDTVMPFHLDSHAGNAQRVPGTPHTWPDAHSAWNKGRFGEWPRYKQPQSMGYYEREEIAFQAALADAFTLCDAYHCSLHGGTNPNRLFLFTGTNDPAGTGGGPAIDNQRDDLSQTDPGYSWTSYAERLEAAGVSWKVYQDMADNFTDNPLEGFVQFRHAYYSDPSSPLMKAVSTTLTDNNLDGLRQDVENGTLPQVSWIVAPAEYSEHPAPSSPVQGGWYMQAVLDALTSRPEVWSRTVLLIMFDENDGFFDHMPPPCTPSYDERGYLAGRSTVDDHSERHGDGQPYGPGPRVPMLIVSPWSRGGWTCSETFDHTSVLRFLERRFGVAEPNVSTWRRNFLGDLTAAFDFATPNTGALPALPQRQRDEADALRHEQEALPAIAIPRGSAPLPLQQRGLRPSRALGYGLEVAFAGEAPPIARNYPPRVKLEIANTGDLGAVLHVYDQRRLEATPRRYAVQRHLRIDDLWFADDDARYDLWILGPNGFHRRLAGTLGKHQPQALASAQGHLLSLRISNPGDTACTLTLSDLAYGSKARSVKLAAGEETRIDCDTRGSQRWYDLELRSAQHPDWVLRWAGRIENGEHSVSDPAWA